MLEGTIFSFVFSGDPAHGKVLSIAKLLLLLVIILVIISFLPLWVMTVLGPSTPGFSVAESWWSTLGTLCWCVIPQEVSSGRLPKPASSCLESSWNHVGSKQEIKCSHETYKLPGVSTCRAGSLTLSIISRGLSRVTPACAVYCWAKNTGVALISTPKLTSPESFEGSHFPVNISFSHCKSRLV